VHTLQKDKRDLSQQLEVAVSRSHQLEHQLTVLQNEFQRVEGVARSFRTAATEQVARLESELRDAAATIVTLKGDQDAKVCGVIFAASVLSDD
jgi:predicted  nucleic acid-binding Zn-ribbon protein